MCATHFGGREERIEWSSAQGECSTRSIQMSNHILTLNEYHVLTSTSTYKVTTLNALVERGLVIITKFKWVGPRRMYWYDVTETGRELAREASRNQEVQNDPHHD